jgi:hypothetical protein
MSQVLSCVLVMPRELMFSCWAITGAIAGSASIVVMADAIRSAWTLICILLRFKLSFVS